VVWLHEDATIVWLKMTTRSIGSMVRQICGPETNSGPWPPDNTVVGVDKAVGKDYAVEVWIRKITPRMGGQPTPEVYEIQKVKWGGSRLGLER